MQIRTLAFALMLATPATLAAQDERALREYFEGRQVVLKLDMPGTESGVDVYPESAQPLNYPDYAGRLKKYGTALRSGESTIVTKVKVKDKLIEFQLAGGGYGTFGDDNNPTVTVPPVEKSKREKDLEKAVKAEPDRAKKHDLQVELDDLRRDREREDRRNQASVAAASEQKRLYVQQRRLEGGSRFNLRYRQGVPAAALTPQAVTQALAKYVDFSADRSEELAGSPGAGAAGPEALPDRSLHRGMLLAEVEALLGPAVRAEQRMEGKYRVSVRTYAQEDHQVTAEFVEGVLISFGVSGS